MNKIYFTLVITLLLLSCKQRDKEEVTVIDNTILKGSIEMSLIQLENLGLMGPERDSLLFKKWRSRINSLFANKENRVFLTEYCNDRIKFNNLKGNNDYADSILTSYLSSAIRLSDDDLFYHQILIAESYYLQQLVNLSLVYMYSFNELMCRNIPSKVEMSLGEYLKGNIEVLALKTRGELPYLILTIKDEQEVFVFQDTFPLDNFNGESSFKYLPTKKGDYTVNGYYYYPHFYGPPRDLGFQTTYTVK